MSYLLLAFPLLLALLVMTTKVVAYWLWMDPANPALWAAASWSRDLVGEFRLFTEMVTGLPDSAIAALFIAAAGAACFASERVRIWSGALLSHFSTLMMLFAPFVFHTVRTSASQTVPLELAPLAFSGVVRFDYGFLLYLGVAMCVMSHIAFLRMSRASNAGSELVIRERCGCI